MSTPLFDCVKTWAMEVDELCSKGDPPAANTVVELAIALRAVLGWADHQLDLDQREAIGMVVDSALRGPS